MDITQGAPFESFGLSEATMRAIHNKGYEVSTPVQAGCIPPMLAGKDVIAKAPTGTGKTMAFGIPIIERIDPESEAVQAVILAPTRELAMQITEEMREVAVCHEGVRLVCLYGGQPIGKQINALKRRPQIVVATPGRLSDHMKRRTVVLNEVSTVVLDEADRMLDMGFIHDVRRILDKIPNRKNLGMFSATISREVMDISWIYQRDPEEITVQATQENKPDILQYRLDVDSDAKVDAIAAIIKKQGLERVICFCNTKGSTERLTKFLQMRGLDAQCIHGDIPQKKREEVMAQFREGKLHVFVATDVASRGIDVDDVDAVFNFDVPEENEYYVHRIGRTGRAKRHGVAYTLRVGFPQPDAAGRYRPQHPQPDRLRQAGGGRHGGSAGEVRGGAMNIWKRGVCLLLTLVMAAALAGCGTRREPQTLRVCLPELPGTLDPAMVTTDSERIVVSHLYENLMKLSSDGQGGSRVEAGAARKYTCTDNNDGTQTYTFTLRDMKWSDGQKVTAADFVYAWQRLADPATASPNAALLEMVAGYRQVRSSGDVSKLAGVGPGREHLCGDPQQSVRLLFKRRVYGGGHHAGTQRAAEELAGGSHGPVYQRGLPHQRMEERSADRHGTGELLRPAATANEHAGVPVRDGCGDEDGAAEKERGGFRTGPVPRGAGG